MATNFRLEHLKFYALLARLPHFVVSYCSGFRITPKPIMMVWEATYRCPASCQSCGRWHANTTSNELTTAEAKQLIDSAFVLGVRLLVVSGGDPLLRHDVLELGAYARTKGMRVVLCTTGALINERNVKSVLRAFDVFELPIDSLSPALHDKLRGRAGMFDRTMQALELLHIHKCPQQGLEVTTVVRDENYQEVDGINQRFAQLGIVTAMQPLHQRLYGTETGDQFEWASECAVRWDKMVDRYQWYDGFSKIALEPYFRRIPQFIVDPSQANIKYRCFAGSYSFFVDPYGDVYICDAVRESVGNVRHETLQNIWSGLTNLRRTISSSRRPCNCWLLCTTPPSLFISRFLCLGLASLAATGRPHPAQRIPF